MQRKKLEQKFKLLSLNQWKILCNYLDNNRRPEKSILCLSFSCHEKHNKSQNPSSITAFWFPSFQRWKSKNTQLGFSFSFSFSFLFCFSFWLELVLTLGWVSSQQNSNGNEQRGTAAKRGSKIWEILRAEDDNVEEKEKEKERERERDKRKKERERNSLSRRKTSFWAQSKLSNLKENKVQRRRDRESFAPSSLF